MIIENLLLLFSWRKVFLLFTLIAFHSFAFTQSAHKVTGTVTDRQNQPLSAVTIKVKGENGNAVTDVDGRYSVTSNSSNAVLEISYVGFRSIEEAINGRNVINISLDANAAKLSEVIVVGYGSQSRATVTTSISKLDNKVLENIPYTNITNAMQGTLPGVRVQSITGQPGAAARVIIRGGTSINNPNTGGPLYVVDGIQRNDVNDLSSEDIESLQVLKDAASTSIYGSRASNGVVIITTKSGKAGRTVVNYSYDLNSG